jgi:uncharacterized protein (DUF2225 family)
MASESPFLMSKVECPICKTINEFEQIKVGAYSEESRDSDFCPRDIHWRYPKYQMFNPLTFFTATCSNCFYTREFNNKYRDWKNDNAYRTYRLKVVKPKHLEQLSMADSTVKRLGEALDIQKYPNESAIIKMHLAILDEQLADHINDLDLGRFYLRIAWVFRCMDTTDDPNKLLLTSLLRELDSRYHAFSDAVASAGEARDALLSSIAAQFESDQLSADMQSIMYGYRDRFNEQSQAVTLDLEAVAGRLQQLASLLHEYRLAVLGSEAGESVKTFKSYASFPDFLRTLTGWNGIVTNEREALEKAIYYYRQAYANGRDIAPGTQQIQASYLIAELSRRIGDHDQAKQFFTSTIKSGQEFIYENRRDQSRTALARKILELAIEQGRVNLAASRPA